MDYPLRIAGQLRTHLRALRKQRGLTQAQLGERIGVGQVRVAEIEGKPGLVSVDQLVDVISALGATLVLRDNGPGGALPATARAKAGKAAPAAKGKQPVALSPKKGTW